MEIHLVQLLVGGVVLFCVYIFINWLPIGPPFKQIALVIFGPCVLLWLLSSLGIISGGASTIKLDG